MDELTVWLIGLGTLGLVLWYSSRAWERRQEINRLVGGELVMAGKHDHNIESVGGRSAQLMNDLPARLNRGWMEHKVDESIATFEESPGLFENWLITLRDRYRTPREIEIYQNAEKKLRAKMSFLKIAIDADVAIATVQEQHDIQTLKVKTAHVNAKKDYDIATGTAELAVDNTLTAAKIQNVSLRRQLTEAEAAAGAATRPLIETSEAVRQREREQELADAEHETALARERAEKAKHEAAARDHRRSRTAPKPSTGDAPPPPRATASERRALLVQAEDLKAKALSKVETQAREDAENLKRKFGADSEEYRDREDYWQHRLVTFRGRDPVTFLGQEDQERLGRG